MFLVDLLFRFAGFSFARWFPVWPLVFIYIGQIVYDTSYSNFFGGNSSMSAALTELIELNTIILHELFSLPLSSCQMILF